MARIANAQLSDEILSEVPKRVVSDAQSAGFNPVTWLNAGALGFYNNAYSLKSWSPSQAINIPSVGQAIGGAISAGANAFATQYRFDQKMAFESSALDRKLSAFGSSGNRIASAPNASDWVGNIQSALGGTGGALYAVGSAVSSRGVGGLSASRAASDNDDLAWGQYGEEGKKAALTLPWHNANPPMNMPDASTIEDALGDGPSEAYSWWRTANWYSKYLTARPGMNDARFDPAEPGMTIGMLGRRMWGDLMGYPVYEDGARGLSWGRPAAGWNPGPGYTGMYSVMGLSEANLRPNAGYSTGGGF